MLGVIPVDGGQAAMRMHFESLLRLETASAVRALLTRLEARLGTCALHITLLHNWEFWILRIRSCRRLEEDTALALAAILSDYGCPVPADSRLGQVFLDLDRGLPPVEVMRRRLVPIVACGRYSDEELEAFCHSLSQGLGYSPRNLT